MVKTKKMSQKNLNSLKELRRVYLKKGLDAVPRVLSLMDKNPFSKTYGCCDREYWHYKMRDFPMSVPSMSSLLLALVHKNKFEDNPYYNNPRIKELCLASINFTAKASYNDGSCDEYYPFEKALGVVSFSLYACTEAYLILEEKNKSFEDFFEKRASWLLKHDEPSTISNHQIVTAMALFNVYQITKKEKYMDESKKRINKALRWMSKEGWFYEYEGCDPGYHTFSIDFLAKYYNKTNDKRLLKYLKKAVEFSSYFIHPDGSYAGFYGSRSTAHFLPHGFEILGKEIPLCTKITDLYINGLKNGKNEFMNDDKYFFFDYDYLQAYLDFCNKRNGPLKRDDFRRYFDESGFFVEKKGERYIVINCMKGGQFRLFKDDKNICNDSGLIGTMNDDVFVSHNIGDKKIEIKDNEITEILQTLDYRPEFARPEGLGSDFWDAKKQNLCLTKNDNTLDWHPQFCFLCIKIKGRCVFVNKTLLSPIKLIIFRAFLITLGRSNRISKFIKRALTRFLILRKKFTQIYFEKAFVFDKESIIISDSIKNLSNRKIKRLAFGTSTESIYVPTSKFYQESDLFQQINLNNFIKELNEKKSVEIKRIIK